jgi:hypothetical protein
MQSSLENELRHHVLDYLEGRATLDQLNDWLISVIWSFKDPDHPAPRLAYEIFMALADQSSDLTTESEMRQALYDVIRVGQASS